MTEAIKQWVSDQGRDYANAQFPGGPVSSVAKAAQRYESGLTKGIEIAEGFAEFCMEKYIAIRIANGHEFIFIQPGSPQHNLTTSQLLEAYLKTLEK